MFFYALKELKDGFPAFFDAELHVGICLLKEVSVELEHQLIKLFAAELSEVLLEDDFLVVFGKLHSID